MRENLNNFILDNHIDNVVTFQDCNRYNSYEYDSFKYKSNFKDSFCCIHNEAEVIQFFIESFEVTNNYQLVRGRRFIEISSYFEKPMNSIDLGIIVVSSLADRTEVFPVTKIKSKYCRLPLDISKNKYLLIPMLHETGSAHFD